MNVNCLFPNVFKKAGWFVLIPAVILGISSEILEYTPQLLDCNVLSIDVDAIFNEKRIFGFEKNNILNEILGVLIIISGLMVAFSKEKAEDEYISKIRLESLVWAVYVNYGILLFSFLFIFGFSFLWIMIFNMFTILVFFILRFN